MEKDNNKKEIEEMIFINKETGEKILTFDTPAEMKISKSVLAPDIVFMGADGLEIMKLKSNGDIFVKGNLVENDSEVVEGLRKFLLSHGVR